MAVKLQDLPEPMRSVAQALIDRQDARIPSVNARTEPIRRRREPNKTETDYRNRILAGRDARYEALTFRMSNGHRYTPDWVVFEHGAPVECHEVKGGYKLVSYQRARLAFDQCAREFPGIDWIWGEHA